MKLLFDQNVSYKIVRRLQEDFSDCSHISSLGLLDSSDNTIWEYAKNNNYCIVTFDYDFIDFSMLRRAPPKVIIIRKGNTKTESLVSLFISQETTIKDFLITDLESTILELV